MKKKMLICKNDNYNGSSCPRCLIKQNFLDFPAYEFAIEGVPSNCDTCGAELSWETIDVKKQLNPKLITAIVAGVILIAAVVLFKMGSSSDVENPVESTEVVQKQSDVEPDSVVIEEKLEVTPTPQPVRVEQPKSVKTLPEISDGSAPTGTLTLTLDGNTYKGEVKNGKAHGLGTMYYLKSTQISPKDLKKRMAEAGDYVTGEFYEGALVQGKLFDKNNELKEIITIGR